MLFVSEGCSGWVLILVPKPVSRFYDSDFALVRNNFVNNKCRYPR
jgi:hypothetical protein